MNIKTTATERPYESPQPVELASLLTLWGLSTKAASPLLDVDERTVRKWVSGQRAMPFVSLYTLAHRAGKVTIEPGTWRESLGYWDTCRTCGGSGEVGDHENSRECRSCRGHGVKKYKRPQAA